MLCAFIAVTKIIFYHSFFSFFSIAYNAIYLRAVPFVCVQCYFCEHSAIFMLTVLLTCLICMRWYLCGYSDIFTYMNGFLCGKSAIYVRAVLFLCA